jgi:hypothetical protein
MIVWKALDGLNLLAGVKFRRKISDLSSLSFCRCQGVDLSAPLKAVKWSGLLLIAAKIMSQNLKIVIPTAVKRVRALISARAGRRDLAFISKIGLYLCSYQ